MINLTNPMSRYKLFFIVMGLLCVSAIVLNLVVRRGPVQDANAVEDLRIISSNVQNYYSRQAHLPAELTEVQSNLSAASRERLHNYEYVVISATQYRLCATFNADSNSGGIQTMPYPAPGYTDPSIHAKGHQCFEYDAASIEMGGPKAL